MKTLYKFALACAVVCVYSLLALANPEATAIIKKSDKFRSPQRSHSVTVKVIDFHDQEKKESVYSVDSDGKNQALVTQNKPDRFRGRKLLMKDKDLWLYTPNINRPTRISFEQKLTGEVSNGDLMRTNFSEDYDARIVERPRIKNQQLIKLHLVAKNKNVTYRSIDYWLAEANNRPVRAIFYALSGKALKTANYLKFQNQNGQPRLAVVEIIDAIQSKKKSRLYYEDFTDKKFSSIHFSKELLNR